MWAFRRLLIKRWLKSTKNEHLITNECTSYIHQIIQRFTHTRMGKNKISQESVFLSCFHCYRHTIDNFAGLRTE